MARRQKNRRVGQSGRGSDEPKQRAIAEVRAGIDKRRALRLVGGPDERPGRTRDEARRDGKSEGRETTNRTSRMTRNSPAKERNEKSGDSTKQRANTQACAREENQAVSEPTRRRAPARRTNSTSSPTPER